MNMLLLNAIVMKENPRSSRWWLFYNRYHDKKQVLLLLATAILVIFHLGGLWKSHSSRTRRARLHLDRPVHLEEQEMSAILNSERRKMALKKQEAIERRLTPLEHAFEPLYTADKSKIKQLGTQTLSARSLTPVLWHVPKSGGTTLKRFVACLDVAIACEAPPRLVQRSSGAEPGANTTTIFSLQHRKNRGYFIDVDVSSLKGIQAAHNAGFQDWLPTFRGDMVIVTSLVQTAAKMLFPNNTSADRVTDIRGLLLAVLRDPIDRQVSLFNYLKQAKHEPTYHSEWGNMTIMEWDGVEDNWMVRVLSGVLESKTPYRPLYDDDLQKAIDILSRYCLIGLTEQMGVTLDRFGSYFGWNQHRKWSQCRAKFGQTKQNSVSGSYTAVTKHSPEWHHVARKNKLDLILFEHAKAIFAQQKHM